MSDLYDDAREANAAAWCALKPHLPGFRHVKTTEQGTIRAETDDPRQAIEVWSHQPYNKPRRVSVIIGREHKNRSDHRAIGIESTATPTGHRMLIKALPAFLEECRTEWERRAQRAEESSRRYELARDIAGITGHRLIPYGGGEMTRERFQEGESVSIYTRAVSVRIDPYGNSVTIEGTIPEALAVEIVRAIVEATK